MARIRKPKAPKTAAPVGDINIENLSEKELRKAIHKYGKRAMSRLKSLKKAFSKGGSMYGKKSYVLDRWGDYNTKVKGKSVKALRLQLQTALDILNAKGSTVQGIREMENQRRETFRKNHPNLLANGKEPSPADIDKAMRILGKIQAAEKGLMYDSDEQLAMAWAVAEDYTSKNVDEIMEDLLNDAGEMEISSHEWFSNLPVEEQEKWLPVSEEDENVFD